MSLPDPLFIGCDHAGYRLKIELLAQLNQRFPDLKITDLGCHSEASVDYPEIGRLVAQAAMAAKSKAILICGSGIGISIAANKVAGVRAAVAWDATSARLSREHNDANILCLGARLVGSEVAREIVERWLTTDFAGGRHTRRVQAIEAST